MGRAIQRNRRARNLVDLLDEAVVEEVEVEPTNPEPLFAHRIANLANAWGARLETGAP